MTNHEAIEILRCIRVYEVYPKSASEETKQALDLAIKALEEKEEMESAIEWRKDTNCVTVSTEPATEEDREKLKKLFQDPLPVEIDITEQYKRQLAILTANSLQRIIDPIVEALPRIIDSSISAIEKMSPEDLIRIATEGEWIPVSERLPEIYREVMVTDIETSDTYESQYLGNGYWECDNGTFKNRIIAWMPKPEPYKEAENDNK